MGKVRGHPKEQGADRWAPASPEVVIAGAPRRDGDAGSVPTAWERLRSRDLAVKIFVAGATYVALAPFTQLGAIVGVMVSPVVSDLIRDYVDRHYWSARRLRRRSAAVAVLGHEEEAYAARQRAGRGPGGGIPGALMASVAAVAFVSAGIAATKIHEGGGSANPGESTSTIAVQASGSVDRVTGLTGVSPTVDAPFLRWRPVPGARRYLVYEGAKVVGRTDEPQFRDVKAPHGVLTYRVVAEANGHRSRPSHRHTIVYQATASPAAGARVSPPNALEARGPNADPPSLGWASVDHADQYGVYRDGVLVRNVPATEFVDSAAAPGPHVYAVTAWVSGIESRPSNALSVDYSPLLAAPVVTGDSPTTHPPRFTWTDVPGAVKGYAVYRDGIEVTVTTNHAFAEKVPLGRYTYTVRAIDANGIEGKASDGLVIDYVAPPPPPIS